MHGMFCLVHEIGFIFNALQRHNIENLKIIFPGKELHATVPIPKFHVSDLYIPLVGLPILLQENRWEERWKK
jgi:hypothetical protein